MQPPAIGGPPLARVLFFCFLREAGFCVRRVLVYLADGFFLSGYSGWKDPARPEGPRTLGPIHDDDLHARRR